MIETVSLLPVLDEKLISLLKSLSADDWNKPTLAKLWTVKDIAAHLLDGNVRTLSLDRDKHQLIPDVEINSYETLVAYLNKINAEWVKACKRMSPSLLTELLEITGKQYSQYMASLDPEAPAIFSVAWAGEDVSKNWFHIAREYTEKWHHQQQIREATGKPGILTRELFYPFIDTLIQALPHTYRNTKAADGTAVQITIETELGGDWFLLSENNKWSVQKTVPATISAGISIPPDVSWKLFTKGLTQGEAVKRCSFTGDKDLAAVSLSLIAIMG